jgi:hypothetical protein
MSEQRFEYQSVVIHAELTDNYFSNLTDKLSRFAERGWRAISYTNLNKRTRDGLPTHHVLFERPHTGEEKNNAF